MLLGRGCDKRPIRRAGGRGRENELSRSGTGMAKILVVDDQRNMRTTLAMMMRGSGYEVDEAADGTVGRELGTTGAFDVVLTDLRMGGSDGIEVLSAIKQAQP